MKVIKEAFARFLDRVGVKGLLSEVVIEPDGTITKSNDNELLVLGVTGAMNFGEKAALTNIQLIAKIVRDVEGENVVLELAEKRLMVLGKDEKYEFRLADPAAVESLHASRNQVVALIEKMLKITVPAVAVKKTLKAIANLSAQRMSVFSEDGLLCFVVYDEATESTATIEVCKNAASFKHDFAAQTVARALELAGDGDVNIRAGKDMPLFIELPGGEFIYMISYMEVEMAANTKAEVGK